VDDVMGEVVYAGRRMSSDPTFRSGLDPVGGVWQVYERCRRLINHDFMVRDGTAGATR
jgi:hypothetical protein